MKTFQRLFMVAAGALLMSSCGYNTMIEKQENINKVWADVETQYQRRSDLIPNLVAVVKGYADFEQETLTAVIEARAKATSVQVNVDDLSPEAIAQFQQAQQQLGGALSRLLVSVERYPDLKASQQFMQLQAQLEGTENRISVARNNFNTAVGDYNTYIRKFPKNIIANMFNFDQKGYFQSDPGTAEAPKVEF